MITKIFKNKFLSVCPSVVKLEDVMITKIFKNKFLSVCPSVVKLEDAVKWD